MFNTKMLKVFIMFLFVSCTLVNSASVVNIRDNEPTIVMHDTIVVPGELLLQIDALNFTGDNGKVAAITLRIEIDTFLIQFISLQNTTLAGSWLGNYNVFQNEITITYTAPFGNGYDVDGKLLDLKLDYFGGFTGDLHFKSTCDISNVNLQTIQGVIYDDGSIGQVQAVGEVSQDTIDSYSDQSFVMPVTAVGDGYDMINELYLRIDYDTNEIIYLGYEEIALAGISVTQNESTLTIQWNDTVSPVSFTLLDTIINLEYKYVGDTNTTLEFLPGSKVFNDGVLVATDFNDGFVRVNFFVDLINNPDTAGTSAGDGYYLINDLVTVVATPEDDFHFQYWTQFGNIVSTDSSYSYIKQGSNDTLTANFAADSGYLSLVSYPTVGGEMIGEGYYQYGEQVTVMAIPNEGYEFMHWLYGSDTISYNPVYEFVMPNYNMELIAVFDTLELIINAEPNNIDYGSVEGAGIYNFGETASLTALPAEGYKFVAWTENGQTVSVDLIYVFIVSEDRDLVANFQIDTDCSAPIGLYINNLSETEAELNWLPSGDEEEWDVLWGETGFDTISGGILIQGLSEPFYLLDGLDPGTGYDFYVKAICSNQFHSNWSDGFTFSTWFVSINTNKRAALFVFPNPVENELNIRLTSQKPRKVLYRIINSVGVPVMWDEIIEQTGFSIDVGNINSGIYYLQVIVGERQITKLFIKK